MAFCRVGNMSNRGTYMLRLQSDISGNHIYIGDSFWTLGTLKPDGPDVQLTLFFHELGHNNGRPNEDSEEGRKKVDDEIRQKCTRSRGEKDILRMSLRGRPPIEPTAGDCSRIRVGNQRKVHAKNSRRQGSPPIQENLCRRAGCFLNTHSGGFREIDLAGARGRRGVAGVLGP
jgi:hypothetical protein